MICSIKYKHNKDDELFEDAFDTASLNRKGGKAIKLFGHWQ